MLELLREYLTVEQIAERWAVDPIDVQQLILIRQLKQSFVVFGPATIYLPVDDGSLRFHPLTERGSVPSCILVDALSDAEDFYLWPLAQVSKAFDFPVHGVNRHELLEAACLEARDLDTGSLIAFDKETTTILGQDAVKIASEALRDTSLIPLETLLEFEARTGIRPNPADEGPRPTTTETAPASGAVRLPKCCGSVIRPPRFPTCSGTSGCSASRAKGAHLQKGRSANGSRT